MRHEILVVGRGGQGILLLGRVLGTAIAKYTGLYATATESYGAETRGTESRVEMIVSDSPDEIDYTRARSPTILLFMYPYGLDKYLGAASESAAIFLNADLISEEHEAKVRGKSSWRVYRGSYNEVAEREAGTVRAANMVALGHLVAKTNIVEPEHVERAIGEFVAGDWLEKNIRAFRSGLSLP